MALKIRAPCISAIPPCPRRGRHGAPPLLRILHRPAQPRVARRVRRGSGADDPPLRGDQGGFVAAGAQIVGKEERAVAADHASAPADGPSFTCNRGWLSSGGTPGSWIEAARSLTDLQLEPR